MWQKAASPPHMDGSVVFATWCQCALHLIHASLGQVQIPNGISIGSADFAQLTAECPCTLQWAAPSPSKLPLPTGIWFRRPSGVLNPNSISIGSAVSAQLIAEHPYTLQWATLPRQSCPFLRGSGSPSNTWFLGPIWAHNRNVTSIGSTAFAQLTAECPYTLQWAAPSPLYCPFPWVDLDSHTIHCSLEHWDAV